MPVGRRGRDRLRADRERRPGPVLDHDRAAEHLLQLLAVEARQRIHAGAGGERHDDRHGLGGVGLRAGRRPAESAAASASAANDMSVRIIVDVLLWEAMRLVLLRRYFAGQHRAGGSASAMRLTATMCPAPAALTFAGAGAAALAAVPAAGNRSASRGSRSAARRRRRRSARWRSRAAACSARRRR